MCDIETTIFLIRHGECEGNADNRFRGRVDFPLNENGLAQAAAIASALEQEKLDFVFSSPLDRAMQTAEAVAEPHGLSVIADEAFNNMSLGIWENMPKTKAAELFPNEWQLWKQSPEELVLEGGERCDDVRARAFSALERIVSENSGKSIAIVSHRGVLKPLLAAILDIPRPYMWRFQLDNASYSKVVYSASRGYTLIKSNCTEHLAGLSSVKEFY